MRNHSYVSFRGEVVLCSTSAKNTAAELDRFADVAVNIFLVAYKLTRASTIGRELAWRHLVVLDFLAVFL